MVARGRLNIIVTVSAPGGNQHRQTSGDLGETSIS